MSDKMREEFEAWYEEMTSYPVEFGEDGNPSPIGGPLSHNVTLGMWVAWRASCAALQVNSCAGMDDPAAEIAELKRQRDELLAVLGAAIPLIKQARLDWCDQNAESYDEDVVTPYDAILYRPILSLLETKGSHS